MDNSEAGSLKRILLTGARTPCALELARHLHEGGHTVFSADTTSFHILKFSNSIEHSYEIPSPRFNISGFIESLCKIVKKEKIDLIIPVWEEVMYISLYSHCLPCEVFCPSFKLIHQLHHKWEYMQLLNSLGIKIPQSALLKNSAALENLIFKTPYILKKCFSRGSRFTIKVCGKESPKIDIDRENPWIAQEYIEGPNICSFSICHQGRVLAHTAYPVQYTMDGNSCIAFEAINHSKIFNWVKNFVGKIKYTGQIAFDFIENHQGELYSIECNPRATSGIYLFKTQDRIDRAYLNQIHETIFSKAGNSRQILAAMVMYGFKRGCMERKLSSYVKKFFTTKDIVFSWLDLKPFLLEPWILSAYWLQSRKSGKPIPALFTQDLEWDGDPEYTKQIAR